MGRPRKVRKIWIIYKVSQYGTVLTTHLGQPMIAAIVDAWDKVTKYYEDHPNTNLANAEHELR